MKRIIFLSVLFLILTLPASAVDQCYMPNGYVRDDVIHPYYAQLISDYFQRVDRGEIECNWMTYRKYVQGPLSKVTNKLFDDSRREIAPMPNKY